MMCVVPYFLTCPTSSHYGLYVVIQSRLPHATSYTSLHFFACNNCSMSFLDGTALSPYLLSNDFLWKLPKQFEPLKNETKKSSYFSVNTLRKIVYDTEWRQELKVKAVTDNFKVDTGSEVYISKFSYKILTRSLTLKLTSVKLWPYSVHDVKWAGICHAKTTYGNQQHIFK